MKRRGHNLQFFIRYHESFSFFFPFNFPALSGILYVTRGPKYPIRTKIAVYCLLFIDLCVIIIVSCSYLDRFMPCFVCLYIVIEVVMNVELFIPIISFLNKPIHGKTNLDLI